ncbi:hypothetical protein [Haloarchaeobius amylolyticus]|uniref:hypothetical protein n=1 Tax=Haloarchaeobius amylolyticus TaxID=1198296 RepID=UPI002272148D|nr:hypothetical protein [Haloarchaeobius amylolyticus]
MRIRDYLGISERAQHLLSRAMEIGLVGLFFVGLYEPSPGVVVNAGIGLLVLQLPALLERDYGIPMDAGLTLWITSAVFLHALGTAGLPGMSKNLYVATSWWDHMTHALSSSVVAGAGYATVRALDEHRDDIYLPPRFTFVFILSFVIAFGVVWEVVEFALGLLANVYEGKAFLTQFGVDDTMRDLLFNTLGGLVVAVWGQAYLSDVVGAIRHRLEQRTA